MEVNKPYSNGKIEGGGVNVVSLFGDINFQESMIQTNASSGRGGTIGFNANQNITINDANLYARGSPDGGTITLLSLENSVIFKILSFKPMVVPAEAELLKYQDITKPSSNPLPSNLKDKI